jgi:hypothetical protein
MKLMGLQFTDLAINTDGILLKDLGRIGVHFAVVVV